jgi:hypothetical protein
MVINITTWSPDTCGCELSYEWDSDILQEQRTHTFYAMHKVCEHHRGLATTKHEYLADGERARIHNKTSEEKRATLHEILDNNMLRHMKLLKDGSTKREKRDLESMTGQVEAHNFRVMEMFDSILNEPFAHDELIYNVIMDENQTKNIAQDELKQLAEKRGVKDPDIKFELVGQAPTRAIHLIINNAEKITESFTKSKHSYPNDVVIRSAQTLRA